ncbi:hypothetical protein [Winogradskyella sp. UBA3174]|uniref:hypothetical protein n=1 Tax=Winogradskyella sp. UBA3174 TaxID=1947785 RepID=UPI002600AF9A|nr:hypothetical protein [Winogradskyella sp. UBA3174]|tara:strand:- start:6075 stop:6260 length:186 start_codon:yes stop_codon:yes gene_type:complete
MKDQIKITKHSETLTEGLEPYPFQKNNKLKKSNMKGQKLLETRIIKDLDQRIEKYKKKISA